MKMIDNYTSAKARISVILPRNACLEIRESMHKEGYSLREKSKWYAEAIENFLKLPDFHKYVEMASYIEDLSKTETLYISSELDERLDKAIIKVRKKIPTLEGVKSLIVRASIIRRLLASLSHSKNSP